MTIKEFEGRTFRPYLSQIFEMASPGAEEIWAPILRSIRRTVDTCEVDSSAPLSPSNGQIASQVNTVSRETIEYQYDSLKRLTSATPNVGVRKLGLRISGMTDLRF